MIHGELSRTWKKSISANFTWTSLYRIKKDVCGKAVITSSIFRSEKNLIYALSSDLSFIKIKKETFGPFLS